LTWGFLVPGELCLGGIGELGSGFGGGAMQQNGSKPDFGEEDKRVGFGGSSNISNGVQSRNVSSNVT
jgi:hypothetical protein